MFHEAESPPGHYLFMQFLLQRTALAVFLQLVLKT